MSFSTVTDSIYTYRFLKLLVTPFEKTKAYELGIVDETGKRTDKQITTSEERDAFNLFHRLVFNIKRFIGMLPGGKMRPPLTSYVAALALLRENYGVDTELVLNEMDIPNEDRETISTLLEQYSEEEQTPKKKKKKKIEKEEYGTTTADVAMPPTHMKFKAFLRRKKKDDELSEEYLNELFDKPYKFKKVNIALKDRKQATLKADSPQGEIYITLKGFPRSNNFNLDFSVGNRFEITGKGDQFRIFSTVIQGLKMIIDKEKDEIKNVYFSADKEYEDDTFDAAFAGRPASKSMTNLSRSRLYNKMVKKFASKMGFSVDIDDSSERVTIYTLTNKTFKKS